LKRRVVHIGGLSEAALLARLREQGVRLNPAAEDLFANAAFRTSAEAREVEVALVTVAELGFAGGATYPQLVARAAECGLAECPLELGPHLRLQDLDQPEADAAPPRTRPGAPPGSLTVASTLLDDSEETPKGFYLRRIDGELWLRGYRADFEHVWDPLDALVFAVAGGA
jgi:hypothetical protein